MEKEDLIEYWENEGIIKDKRIIKAFREIKREDFVLKGYKDLAYEDIPLPIGKDQTISQPTTIVTMLELLEVKEDSKVLEIGTGSGDNAALLSKLTKKIVYSIETVPELVEFAKANLKKAKITNVKVIQGDGSKGYEKEAPYDRIIATCAAKEIPSSWKKQLKEGGIIVAPIGEHEQVMVKERKIKNDFVYSKHGFFRFVPLV